MLMYFIIIIYMSSAIRDHIVNAVMHERPQEPLPKILNYNKALSVTCQFSKHRFL